ncbi:MAG: thiamine phosphate synthase [Muribaculaceae bacterium]|nr:thiamine phosphate synthase [Muribaculaceae bacterium]
MAEDSFLKIGITPQNFPSDINSEVERIISYLSNNEADLFHLRHPSASISDWRRYLDSIPEQYFPYLTLHDKFELITEYGIGGIHLNSRNPEIPFHIIDRAHLPNIRISTSCHSFAEIENLLKNQFQPSASPLYTDDHLQTAMDLRLHYVTLSPIFDSISKTGYKSAFSISDLATIIPSLPIDVIALGGVRTKNFPLLKSLGFKGAAMLGHFFNNS